MRLTLIGTGLIGGSAAWAMKNAGVFDAVTACDLSLINAQCAVNRGIADRATTSIAEAMQEADAVMVAVPVLAIPKVFAAIAPYLRPGTPVTDVGSTRTLVITGARQALGEHFADYAPCTRLPEGRCRESSMPTLIFSRAKKRFRRLLPAWARRRAISGRTPGSGAAVSSSG